MADIENAKAPNIWPWLIGMVAIVAVLFWMNSSREADNDVDRGPTRADPAVGSTGAMPSALAAFVSFAEAAPPDDVGLARAYAAAGIDRLATALDAVAGSAARDAPVSKQLEIFRDKAGRLEGSPTSLQHAELVRDVFTSAVDVIVAIESEAPQDGVVLRGWIHELRRSAEAVDDGQPLLAQTVRVNAFLDRAADALQQIIRARQA